MVLHRILYASWKRLSQFKQIFGKPTKGTGKYCENFALDMIKLEIAIEKQQHLLRSTEKKEFQILYDMTNFKEKGEN